MTDIGFQLADVARLIRRRFDERARQLGVTRAQWRLLFTLSREEGLNQGGLAELLEVEPISLCRMIDRLEEGGLVERRRDPADRRAWRIHLSERSRPLLDQLHAIGAEVVAQALDGVSAAHREAMHEALATMRGNLSAPIHTAELAHG